MYKLMSSAAAAVCLSLLGACGSPAAGPSAADVQLPGKLALRILPESFDTGGSLLSATTIPRVNNGELLIDIEVQQASGLRAIYFELDTAGQQFGSIELRPAEAFCGGAQALTLALASAPGMLHAGQILVNPLECAGYSGSGVVATLHLGGMRIASRHGGSALPQDESSRILLSERTEQILMDVSVYLDWFAALRGDYDQNGLVGISDLTPLAQHYGEVGPFNYSGAHSVVDGNGDGEISIADVTPIGAHFGDSIDGFRIYRSYLQADYPPFAGSSNGGAALLEEYAFEPGSFNSGERCAIQHIDHPSYDSTLWCYWLRPVDDGVEGLPSNLVRSGEAPPNLPSVSLSSSALEGSAPLTVTLSAEMAQADFPIFNYRFELNGSPPYEYVDNGPDGTLTVTFHEPGVYQPAVSAVSCEGASKSDYVTITVN